MRKHFDRCDNLTASKLSVNKPREQGFVKLLVLIIIIGVAVFFYTKKSAAPSISEKVTAVALEKLAGDGPASAYFTMRNTLSNSQTVNDILDTMREYASLERVTGIEAGGPIENSEIAQQAFDAFWSIMPKLKTIDTNNIIENISGDTAQLTVMTIDNKLRGTIDLVKENGVWKMYDETWNSVDSQL